MNQFRLKPDAIAQTNQIFATYPEISKTILYASRAKGNHKNSSDIIKKLLLLVDMNKH